jgi:hypothetical protein
MEATTGKEGTQCCVRVAPGRLLHVAQQLSLKWAVQASSAAGCAATATPLPPSSGKQPVCKAVAFAAYSRLRPHCTEP